MLGVWSRVNLSVLSWIFAGVVLPVIIGSVAAAFVIAVPKVLWFCMVSLTRLPMSRLFWDVDHLDLPYQKKEKCSYGRTGECN